MAKAPVELNDIDELSHYVIEITRNASDRWQQALLNSSDSRARAVGLVIQSRPLRAGEANLQAEGARDELVQLAAGAGDPVVYATAVGVCRTGLSDAVTTGACRRITLSEWSRLDPDNAIPWLAVAREAREKHDTEAEAAAFTRAATVQKVDNFDESLLQVAQTAIPSEATPLERSIISVEMIGHEALWARPDMIELRQYCSPEGLKDSAKKSNCNALAELLVNRANTLLTLGYGRVLAQRVGWPAERVARIAQEFESLRYLGPTDDGNPYSCASVNSLNEFMNARARLGELAALREIQERVR